MLTRWADYEGMTIIETLARQRLRPPRKGKLRLTSVLIWSFVDDNGDAW